MTPVAADLLTGRRRVTLMRHGEVSYFDADGRPRDPRAVPLTETGRAQARAAADLLRATRFDRVVCSGLPRSRETAALVCGDAGRVEDIPALREVRAGRFRDIPGDRLHPAIARAYDAAADDGARFIGGEAFGAFRARVLDAWNGLLTDPSWQALLVVAHDAVNRVILAEICGAGLGGLAAFEQDLACINLIEVETDRALLRAVNLTPYDPAKATSRLTSMERVYLGYAPSRQEGA